MLAGIQDRVHQIVHMALVAGIRHRCHADDHAGGQHPAIEHDGMRDAAQRGNHPAPVRYGIAVFGFVDQPEKELGIAFVFICEALPPDTLNAGSQIRIAAFNHAHCPSPQMRYFSIMKTG